MKKVLLLIIIIVIIIVGGFLVYQNLTKKKIEKISMPDLKNRKIAMVIAFRDFRDVEYFIPRDIFAGAEVEVTAVSTEKGIAIGADGGEVEVRTSAAEFRVENFDSVVFIGGPGMAKQLDNSEFQQIAREAVENNKILGAICVAPAVLAKAGLLQGKKATVWSSPLDKSAVKILKENGADFQSESVVVEGNIITANGPGAAKEFAEKICFNLTKENSY